MFDDFDGRGEEIKILADSDGQQSVRDLYETSTRSDIAAEISNPPEQRGIARGPLD
jgi:hypothetical protein